MFRSPLILLTLLPVSLEAFVVTSDVMTSRCFMVAPEEEEDPTTPAPFFFEDTLVEKEVQLTPEALLEDIEEQAAQLKAVTPETVGKQDEAAVELKAEQQALLLEDMEEQQGNFQAILNQDVKLFDVTEFNKAAAEIKDKLDLTEFKQKAAEFKTKAQAFFKDDRLQDGLDKAKDLAKTTQTKVTGFLEDDQVKDMTAKATDFAKTTKTRVVEFLEDDQVKVMTAKAKDLMQDGWATFSNVIEASLGSKLKELKQAKEDESKE